MTTISWTPNWKRGAIIRNIFTGKPYLVVHIFTLGVNETSTAVMPLEDRSELTPMYLIAQADYDKYTKDINFIERKNGNGVKLAYRPI